MCFNGMCPIGRATPEKMGRDANPDVAGAGRAGHQDDGQGSLHAADRIDSGNPGGQGGHRLPTDAAA